MASANAYQVLGVDPKASDKEIRMAWVSLVKQHHTDRSDESDEAIKDINAAWNKLKTPEARKSYDQELYIEQTSARAEAAAHAAQSGAAPWPPGAPGSYNAGPFIWDPGRPAEPRVIRIRIHPVALVAFTSFVIMNLVWLRDNFIGPLPGVSWEPVLRIQAMIADLSYPMWFALAAVTAFVISQRALFIYIAIGQETRRSQVALGISIGCLLAFEYMVTPWALAFIAGGVAWSLIWYALIQKRWLDFRFWLMRASLRAIFKIPGYLLKKSTARRD